MGTGRALHRSLVSIFFDLTSASTLRNAAEIQDWQRAAGLTVLPSKNLFSLPGSALLAARK